MDIYDNHSIVPWIVWLTARAEGATNMVEMTLVSIADENAVLL
jgi:hypothetical protein